MAGRADALVQLPRARRIHVRDLRLDLAHLTPLLQLLNLLLLLLHLRLDHCLVDVLVLERIHALLLELHVRADVRSTIGVLEGLATRPLGNTFASSHQTANHKARRCIDRRAGLWYTITVKEG